jgi:hypothetical protein
MCMHRTKCIMHVSHFQGQGVFPKLVMCGTWSPNLGEELMDNLVGGCHFCTVVFLLGYAK